MADLARMWVVMTVQSMNPAGRSRSVQTRWLRRRAQRAADDLDAMRPQRTAPGLAR